MISSPTADPLRVGLIGCGRIAQNKHIPAILSCRSVSLDSCRSRGNAYDRL